MNAAGKNRLPYQAGEDLMERQRLVKVQQSDLSSTNQGPEISRAVL
jgi:hypothetical protein